VRGAVSVGGGAQSSQKRKVGVASFAQAHKQETSNNFTRKTKYVNTDIQINVQKNK
jgi:hypothetical protein